MTQHTWRSLRLGRGRSDDWMAFSTAQDNLYHLRDKLIGASYPVRTRQDGETFGYTLTIPGKAIVHASGFLTLDDALDDAIAALERQPQGVKSS